ncbi:hypothetical protein K439DRAFT_1622915 [Ramaria rubella]|nr:hypothetical protein K439DRAFT_1622915 [Ramaria rubella]
MRTHSSYSPPHGHRPTPPPSASGVSTQKDPANWSVEDEMALIELLIEHKARAASFQERSQNIGGMQDEVDKAYETVQLVRLKQNLSGFTYLDDTGVLVDDEHIWAEFARKNPDAGRFGRTGFPHYEAMSLIMPSAARGTHTYQGASAPSSAPSDKGKGRVNEGQSGGFTLPDANLCHNSGRNGDEDGLSDEERPETVQGPPSSTIGYPSSVSALPTPPSTTSPSWELQSLHVSDMHPPSLHMESLRCSASPSPSASALVFNTRQTELHEGFRSHEGASVTSSAKQRASQMLQNDDGPSSEGSRGLKKPCTTRMVALNSMTNRLASFEGMTQEAVRKQSHVQIEHTKVLSERICVHE